MNIYPLMCHLLGLDPAPNNGSLTVLYETLLNDQTRTINSRLTALLVVGIVVLLFLARYVYKRQRPWRPLASFQGGDKNLAKKQF